MFRKIPIFILLICLLGTSLLAQENSRDKYYQSSKTYLEMMLAQHGQKCLLCKIIQVVRIHIHRSGRGNRTDEDATRTKQFHEMRDQALWLCNMLDGFEGNDRLKLESIAVCCAIGLDKSRFWVRVSCIRILDRPLIQIDAIDFRHLFRCLL